jgi:hypothetical protein
MSANGEKSAVMKGITHGACDYLLKPVRIEELRNIWQHVVRKKRQETKEVGHSKSLDEGGDRQRRGGVDDNDYTSSATDTDGNWKCTKKRKESKEEEEDNEQENDDPSTMKKPRVVWSVELHQQFVSAVNQLGIDSKIVFTPSKLHCCCRAVFGFTCPCLDKVDYCLCVLFFCLLEYAEHFCSSFHICKEYHVWLGLLCTLSRNAVTESHLSICHTLLFKCISFTARHN